jgi:Fe2+ transport system protein FeoA
MTPEVLPLAVLQPGEAGVVTDVLGRGPFRRRLLDMGFIRGAPVKVIKLAPLMDPIEYCVGGIHVTLRRKEAMHVVVERREECVGPGRRPGGRLKRHHGRRRFKGPRWWRRGPSE